LKKRSRSWIGFGIFLVVFLASAVLLAYLLRDLDWSLIGKTAPIYAIPILLLSVAGTAFYTLAIYLLVRASGHQTTISQAYLVLTASLSMNYITPVKAGIPLRIYLYKHVMGIPTATGTALIACETLVGMVTPALIAVVGIAFLFPFIGLLGPLLLLLAIGGSVAAILLIPPERVMPLARRLPFQNAIQRVARFGGQVQISLKTLPAWALLSTTGLVVLNFITVAIRLYLILHVLDHPIELGALVYAQAISVTGGNISMIPMGLGIRDASLTLLLLHLGIPNKVALSVAIIQRLFSPGWPLLLGLVSNSILGTRTILSNSETGENDT
jgi:uncharacterized membrane protein YbhN (UPF0104 family)